MCTWSVSLPSVHALLFIVTSLSYLVTSHARAGGDGVVACCPFNYLHTVTDICASGSTSGELLAVVVVCSAVDNAARRDAIRGTWAADSEAAGRHRLRVVFVLGRSSLHGRDSVVDDEARRHGDIVQADFVDSYSNLSVKSLAALQWTASKAHCARFIVKTDDDTFINTQLLTRDLATTSHRNFIMGHVIARAHPVRMPGAKWFTPTALYAADVYPSYASGAAYVISGDAVRPLLRAASSLRQAGTRVFSIEDVYVTGMLARAAGLQLIVNGKFDGYRAMPDDCAVRNHISIHRVSVDDMYRLWTVVTTDPSQLNCRRQTLN